MKRKLAKQGFQIRMTTRSILLISVIHALTKGLLVFALRPPSFISGWIDMQVNHPNKSMIRVQHKLGVQPIKVDIQVKVTEGVNTGFMFPGYGSAQVDDDENTGERGGVGYIYNEEEVVIDVMNSNNTDIMAIDTGGKGEEWIEENQQSCTSISVRIRAWHPDDYPEPSYQSDWLTIDSTNETLNFIEVFHGLSTRPVFVTVQVKVKEKNRNVHWICEGQGSSMVLDRNLFSDWGGVIFGYNARTVRLWAPSSSPVIAQGHVCFLDNGWGHPEGLKIRTTSGIVQISAWESLGNRVSEISLYKHSSIPGNLDQTGKGDLNLHEFNIPVVNISTDLVQLKVQAISGANSGFIFGGLGSAMRNIGDRNMGGVIYGYTNKLLRLWHPYTAAYLLYIGPMWADGIKNHAETTVRIWVSIFSVTVCDEPADACFAHKTIGGYSPGANVTYECFEGRVITNGDETRYCEHDGWNGTEPVCEAIFCPLPESAVNADITYTNVKLGARVTHTCHPGYYHASGNLVRCCETNGLWDGVLPICERINCGEPLHHANALYTIEGTFYGDAIIYRCVEGYRHVNGSLIRSCDIKGDWTGSAPVCESEAVFAAALQELKVNAKNTSKRRRSLESAVDERRSAKAIGYLGAVVLSVFLGLLVLTDLSNFVGFVKDYSTRC